MAELLEADARQLLKGDAIVSYAEALKQIWDLVEMNNDAALELCQATRSKVLSAASELDDAELYDIADLLAEYDGTLQNHY